MTVVHLVGNPAARHGRGAHSIDQVAAALAGAGATVEPVSAPDRQGAVDALTALAAAGVERVVVAGGDGMVHLAVQALAQTDVVLGVVPVGTGNDFAGALGIPSDVDAAAQNALRDATAIDLLRIDTTWAASIATIGFSAAVNARANTMRWPRGSARYTVATLMQLPALSSERIELVLDGDPLTVDAAVLTLANTSDFGGGMRISPAARPDDGIADLTVVGSVGRLELLWFFRKVFNGTHMDHPKVSGHRATTIEITTAGLEMWADGEPAASTPATVAVVPNALRLAGIVPL